MNGNASELAAWFKERPQWLQDSARRLFHAGVVTTDDLKELLVLCKREAGIRVEDFEGLKPLPISTAAFDLPDAATTLRLEAISEIKGINALAPRKGLLFGTEPLVIIYGANGSGKSGYIRVLKHACGGRGVGTLHGDVFAEIPQAKSCKITYSLGSAQNSVAWTPAIGVHTDLRTVALYDTDCAHVYINNENQVTYEPPLLAYFSVLVGVCEKINTKLEGEILARTTSKPALPSEYTQTTPGVWFNAINWQTSEAGIEAQCTWSDAQETGLRTLNQRISETDPTAKAKALRKTKGHLSEFTATLKEIDVALSDEAFATLMAARTSATTKRRAAEVDAKMIFDDPRLNGIASESWRLMWEQARLYSESEAYISKPFPNIEKDAVCVLCQQTLDEPTKERFSRFEAFVKSGLETEAATAEKLVADTIAKKKDVPVGDDLEAKLDLAGVSDETIRGIIRSHCDDLSKRRTSFLSAATAEGLLAKPSEGAIEALESVQAKYEVDAKAFDEDAKVDKKAELRRNVRALNAQKWLSQQKVSISAEVERLKAIRLLDEARRLTATNALSTKKSSLAEVLVTDAFKERFKTELKLLGAARVKVAIEKTKATKGQVLHQIVLKGKITNHPAQTGEVLSEGEFRIVSLAAFLADVAAGNSNAPFIFDDPISSLDQDFEELTASRLAELSKSRQVIVFTHRLSLLGMLEDAAEKATISSRVVSLQREPWGMGEPNEPPLPAQKPKTALNSLIGQRLPRAKEVWKKEGVAPYQIEAKALCSDIRITIERLIENDLLADVVQRFRRPINTMGKIGKLARIKPADCSFLDDMMTKYSRFEHSQPGEAPVPLPEPDELTEDLLKLKGWLEEFTSRVV